MNGTLWTILIAAALVTLGVLAVRSLLKDRKKGGCSGGCAGCPHSGSCHK